MKTISFSHRSKTKSLVSFFMIFMLLLALLPAPNALAATTTVTTEAQLKAAISGASNGDVIEIGADIDIVSGATYYSSSSAGRTVTINGNGHTLRQAGTTSMFKFHYGTLTFNNIIFDGNNQKTTTFKYGGAAISGRYASITVNDCVFLNNYTTGSSTGGGAISTQNSSSTLTVTNSTFYKNRAAEDGGAIYSGSKGMITNCTFYGNTAGGSGGAVRNNSSTATSQSILLNCIAIGNTAESASEGHDIYRANDGGYNLFGTAVNLTNGQTSTTSGVINTGWLDITLKDNGGANSTLTLALLPGSSPAIDGGTASGAPQFDQRGIPRDAKPDIGAYEYRLAKTDKFIKSGEVWAMTEVDANIAEMLANATYSSGYEDIIAIDPDNPAVIKGITPGVVTIEAVEYGFKMLDITITVSADILPDKVTGLALSGAPDGTVSSEIPFTIDYAIGTAGNASKEIDWLITLSDGSPLPNNVVFSGLRTDAASGQAEFMLVNEADNGVYRDYDIKISAKSVFDFTVSESVALTLKKPEDTAVIGVSLSADTYSAKSEESINISYLVTAIGGNPDDPRVQWTIERPASGVLVNGLTDGQITGEASGKITLKIRNSTSSLAVVKITATSVDNPYRSASLEIKVTGVSKQVMTYNDLYRALRDANDGDCIAIGADLTAQKVTYLSGVDAISSASINSATRSLQSALSVSADVTIDGNGYTIDGGGYYAIFYLKSGSLTLRNLTITNANNTNTSSSEKQGSAICAKNGSGEIILENVTIQNCKTDVGNGAAVYIDAGSTARISNCTIVDNTAKYGGAIYSANGEVCVENSIILRNRAGTQGDDIYFAPASSVSRFYDLGYNLLYDCVGGSGSGSSATAFADTLFDATSLQKEQIDTYGSWLSTKLTNNGGHSKTVALLNGTSPAIDKIPTGRCPKTDERGLVRTGLGDIGAYELHCVSLDLSLEKGEKVLLDDYFTDDANATMVIDAVAKWTSDDKKIATADIGYGYIDAHNNGATVIHGFNDSGSEVVTVRVFVGNDSIGDVSISGLKTGLDRGESALISYLVCGKPWGQQNYQMGSL